MKLGDAVIDPLTGRTGWLHKFVGSVALYRDASGRLFKRQSPDNRTGHPCRIRIKDLADDAPWLDGVMVNANKARVTSPCPVWFGAIVTHHTAEIDLTPPRAGAAAS
jgi:hypothetical protein